MKKQMICITGNVSSGKSATAKEIANVLSWKLYKASEAFREKARELNMNIVDFCKYVEENPDIDKAIELKTKEIAEDVDGIVIDARLGFYVVKDAFKVYMTCDENVAAARLLNCSRGKEEEYISKEDALEAIRNREQSERARYLKLYGVDIQDLSQYDFVIDTTHITVHEAAEKIIEAYRVWEG